MSTPTPMDDTMEAVSNRAASETSRRLADPDLRRMLERFVRRRVPEAEVDDVVQTVLCDALAADNMPDDHEQLRKWLMGITRHKVADFHRQGARTRRGELPAELPGEDAPDSAREWARWAEKQTEGDAEAQRTLDWMAREGGGEKLAHIAEDEKLPATQVRQRVSRLRRFMRERWAAELAAVAAVVIAVLVAWLWLRRPAPTAEPVLPTPAPELTTPPELERAAKLRADALAECDREAWTECLDGLDEAARLDPAGDRNASVRDARRRATGEIERRKEEQLKEEQKKQAPKPVQSATPPRKPNPAPPRKKELFDKKGEPIETKKEKELPNEPPNQETPQQQAPQQQAPQQQAPQQAPQQQLLPKSKSKK